MELLSNYLKSVQTLNMTISIYLIAYITICVILSFYYPSLCNGGTSNIILLQLDIMITDYYYVYQI